MQPVSSAEIEQLTQQLHRANERFRLAHRAWEKWLDATDFRHGERVDSARQSLQEAEDAVEKIEHEIRRKLRGGPDTH